MSNTILNLCWPLQMPPTAKAILIALADRANDDGAAWPSLESLVERTCFHRGTVIEAIQWLEAAHALIADRSNGRKTNYRLTPDQFDPATATTSRRSESRASAATRATNQSGKPTGRIAQPVGQNDKTSRAKQPHPSGKTTEPVGQPDTIHHEPSMNHKDPSPRARKLPHELPTGFLEFWEAWPKKDARSDAVRAWCQQRLDTDARRRAEAMAGLAGWKQQPQWTKDGGRYIPNPGTWLRGERWSDQAVAKAVAAVTPAVGADGSSESWWSRAGFPNVHEAENEGCYAHNSTQFCNGKRVIEATEELA